MNEEFEIREKLCALILRYNDIMDMDEFMSEDAQYIDFMKRTFSSYDEMNNYLHTGENEPQNIDVDELNTCFDRYYMHSRYQLYGDRQHETYQGGTKW